MSELTYEHAEQMAKSVAIDIGRALTDTEQRELLQLAVGAALFYPDGCEPESKTLIAVRGLCLVLDGEPVGGAVFVPGHLRRGQCLFWGDRKLTRARVPIEDDQLRAEALTGVGLALRGMCEDRDDEKFLCGVYERAVSRMDSFAFAAITLARYHQITGRGGYIVGDVIGAIWLMDASDAARLREYADRDWG